MEVAQTSHYQQIHQECFLQPSRVWEMQQTGFHLIDMRNTIIILLLFAIVGFKPIYELLVTDTTMTGEGNADSPLKIDTTVISTKANVLVVGVRKTGAVTETIDGQK